MINRAPTEALYLHAGLWAGMALILLQVLKLGVIVPPRTFNFAWVFYALIVLRATAILSTTSNLGGRLIRNLSLLVVLSYMLTTFYQYTIYRSWQAETRALAAFLNNEDPTGERPTLVYGDIMTLSSAKKAYIQDDMALTFRMQQLTGHKVVLCHSDPDACTQINTSRRAAGLPLPIEVAVETSGDKTLLRSPVE